MKNPYFYSPDEYFDAGELGEHPLEFQAWIRDVGPESEPFIQIVRADLILTFGEFKQVVNLLPMLMLDRAEMARWAEEIRRDWSRVKELEWEDARCLDGDLRAKQKVEAE